MTRLIGLLLDNPHIANAKGHRINKEGEDSGEDDLIKDIENDFNSVEQTGEPMDSNWAKIINNVICTPIIKKNLLKNWKTTPDLII